MKRKFFCLSMLFFLALATFAEGRAKYVFYFIGDGMGVNQVNLTETYLAAIQGRIGVEPLLFTGFPATGFVTTYSATNGVTDSAAGGTALATGVKTRNGAVGMTDEETFVPVSVAEVAKAAGAAVGVATSVSIDHATPASFYAHVPNRSMYYEIGKDLVRTGFDFYAGSDFLKPKPDNSTEPDDLYGLCLKAGYTIARGHDDYCKKAPAAKGGMILFQDKGAADRSSLPYAINRKAGELTLAEITQAGIDYLNYRNKDGFFLMVEGGKIDYACHANDAATALQEVMDFDHAIRVAYEFYLQHPKETLIIITADHETGGFTLGNGSYALNFKALQSQQVSQPGFSRIVNRMRHESKDNVTWEQMQQALKENFGFWDTITLSERDEKALRSEYERSFQGDKNVKMSESLYYRDEPIAALAVRILNRIAMVSWPVGSHTAAYVPVFAIGNGAEHFTGQMDNTDIPKRIAKVAGYGAIDN